VKLYLQGRYGRAPGRVNDTVRNMAIGNEEVIRCRPADRLKPEMHRLREEIGELAQSEEDVLTYAMFPEIGRRFLEERAAGTLKPEELKPRARAEATAPAYAPTDFNVTMHGETYHIRVAGVGHKSAEQRPFFVTVDGVPEQILVEVLSETVPTESAIVDTKRVSKGSKRPKATREGQVTSSMPGRVVDVLVSVGQKVKAGDPVLVIEAMKMENEVPAPIAGTVKAVHITKGDNVNPDEALVEIE
jgi:pyruvate carboxylase subunit B